MSKALRAKYLRLQALVLALATVVAAPQGARAEEAIIKLAALEQATTPRAIQLLRRVEPFGLEALPLRHAERHGGLRAKWRGVERKLTREAKVLARCRVDRDNCPPAAQKFLGVIERAVTREGRARIGEVNRSVNLLIRFEDDRTQYGVEDLWASPLMTFASGAGDCEDYAIAKYVALRESGFAPQDLRLVVVRDTAARDYHAVAAVRHEGHWIILDNRNLALREDGEMTQFQPLFVIDATGVKRLKPPAHEPVLAQTPAAAPAASAMTASLDAPGTAAPSTSWALL
ncbi:MAG: transglutaminase-like cysteine peptidase [Alphaproteobacteria bacterium]|nr:transglutaminase-like cysteine peptidase [Alphaproteobacteria bacterium]